MVSMIKRYSDLIKLETFQERFDYLYIGGVVGAKTFGDERYLNQLFYNSSEWKRLRNKIIIRDDGCDLGIPGREIKDSKYIRIHHIDPITIDDIRDRTPKLFDPDNLITCLWQTHQAIHYTGWDGCLKDPVERKPWDTCPWRTSDGNSYN